MHDQERDAEVAALQEQLDQLRVLEQARGVPSPGISDTPRVIAAQLQIEQLQRQLQSALQVGSLALRTEQHDYCRNHHCAGTRHMHCAPAPYPGEVSQAACCWDWIPAVSLLSLAWLLVGRPGCSMLLRWRSPHVQVSQMASLPPTPPIASGHILDGNGKLEDLARKHAAELASLQEAFYARLAALEEDLQVSIASLHCLRD